MVYNSFILSLKLIKAQIKSSYTTKGIINPSHMDSKLLFIFCQDQVLGILILFM